jgi:ankyrin repeat protein
MTQDALKGAAGHGFAGRVQLLLEHGVDPAGLGTRHPVYHGRSALEEAALHGHPEIVTMLEQAGARNELDDVEVFLCAATAGDRTRVEEMLRAEPDLGERARERRPEQLVRAAASDRLASVALLLELGFDPNTVDRTTPLHIVALHEAARLGNLEMISLLSEHGADPNIRDSGYRATPSGWAEHFGKPEAHSYLGALETPT